MVAKIPFTATWVVPGDASDTPASGVVTITPTAEVRDASGAVILTMIGREYELDAFGTISGSLYATDDATVPSGWTYVVKETFVKPGTNIAPAYQRSWNLIVPKDTVGTLDLAKVTDAQQVPLMAEFATYLDLQDVQTTAAAAAASAAAAQTAATTGLATKLDKPTLPSQSALVRYKPDGTVDTLQDNVYWKEGGTWANTTFYPVNAVVLYTSNGLSRYFRCTTAHTSADTGGLDFAKFVSVATQEATAQFEFMATVWSGASVIYPVNKLVVHDDVSSNHLLYRCNTQHTSTGTFDVTKWDLVGDGGAGGGGGSTLVVPNVQTGTSYQLVLTDAGKAVELNNASAITLTIPPNNLVAFPQGTVIELMQRGAGQVTITPGAGVTIRTAASAAMRTQYSVATIRLSGADEWILAGDLV